MSVVALYRVKNEARWIRESLERTLQVAGAVIVLDDHSTDKTVEIAEATDSRVTVERSTFEGFDEGRDREYLMTKAHARGAEWVLFLDGDEVLTPGAVVELKSIIKLGLHGTYIFRVAYLWDSPTTERVDGVYGNITTACFFSIKNRSLAELGYRPTGHNGNMHCPRVPALLAHSRRFSTSLIKHYGYMLAEDRQMKHDFYNALDSEEGRAREGHYAHILGQPSRWAPGPVVLRPFADV